MTIVRTDLGDTREVAKRLRFQQSAGNSATNVQDAIDNVAGGGAAPAPVTITATGAIGAGVVTVNVNSAGVATLTLPDAATWRAANEGYGVPLSIFDVSGAAEANPITLDTTGGQTINGAATLVIDSDYGGYRLRPTPGGNWVVV